MLEFRSWRSCSEFVQSVTLQGRYIREASADEFLNAVLATSKSRKKTIREQSYLWRAQLGCDWNDDGHSDEEPRPFSPKRMKPQANMATEGRANPKGIPYLYLASDKETAMAEVRPWVGSLISIGLFRTMRKLVVVDCSADIQEPTIYLGEPTPEEREQAVWSDINGAFSMPVSLTDQKAEYVPTQVIAELFKNNGADGIMYRSAVGKGLNVVLFDLATAEIVNCFLYEAAELSFNFGEIANPYFVRKH